MNLYFELFYKKYVEGLLFPLPISYWMYFNEALSSFPIIELSQGYPSSSRRTKKIQLIVIHHTGSLDVSKALKWFSNPNNYSSVHYLIDLDGHIQMLVPEEMAALHVPSAVYKHSRLVNEMSVGISLIGDGFNSFSDAQYEAVAMLCAHLQKKYELKNEDVYRHAEIECKPEAIDPAPWDKEKFQTLLAQFNQI